MSVPPILSSILRRNERLGNRASNIRLVPLSRAAELYELSQLFTLSPAPEETPRRTPDRRREIATGTNSASHSNPEGHLTSVCEAAPSTSDPCAEGVDSERDLIAHDLLTELLFDRLQRPD